MPCLSLYIKYFYVHTDMQQTRRDEIISLKTVCELRSNGESGEKIFYNRSSNSAVFYALR